MKWNKIETAVSAVMCDCQILTHIKTSPDSSVFIADVADTQVIIKQFHKDTAAQRVARMKAELDYATQHLGSGRNQINRCLHIIPEHGIAVLSFVHGAKVSALINDADPETRSHLVARSAEWLRVYTTPRQKTGNFGPWSWIRKLRAMNTDAIADVDTQILLAQLLESLKQQASDIAQCSVVRAAGHGDFTGVNLMYHNDVMYGIDIQTESWMSIANEVARFLVFLQIHNAKIFQETRFGIAENDWSAFLESGVLDHGEQQTTLPFLIGVQLYKRIVFDFHRPHIRMNATLAIERYLIDITPDNGGKT